MIRPYREADLNEGAEPGEVAEPLEVVEPFEVAVVYLGRRL